MKLARTEKRKRRKIRSIPKRTMDKGNGGGGEREDSGFQFGRWIDNFTRVRYCCEVGEDGEA